MDKKHFVLWFMATGILLTTAVVNQAAPLGTAFTYQGQLTDGGNPASGEYDLLFKLFDNSISGNQIGKTISWEKRLVRDGYFTVMLDFGSSAFTGEPRWLEIHIKSSEFIGRYCILSPRQPVTPSPYALYAVEAGDCGCEGDITGVIAGIGLTGGGIQGQVQLDIEVPLELTGYSSGTQGIMKGINQGSGHGVVGEHSTSGNLGFLGGANAGAYGKFESNGNFGVLGDSLHGAMGKHDASENWGALGQDDSGVYGKGMSFGSNGILGQGEKTGVRGIHDLSGNEGQLGTSNYGVYAINATNTKGYLATSFYGAVGSHPDGNYGRLGAALYGVYGFGNPYAGYFEGDVYISGNVGIGVTGSDSPLHIDLVHGYAKFGQSEGKILCTHYDGGGTGAGMEATLSDGSTKALLAYETPGRTYAGYFQGDMFTSGSMGIGTNNPQSRLHVSGGAWNLATSEGDLKIGDSIYRLKIGVATSGAGAGDVYVRAQGGSNRLVLGSDDHNVVQIQNETVKIGTSGTPFTDIKQLTGYITHDNGVPNFLWTDITLPAGWDMENTRVLTVEIKVNTQVYGIYWSGLGEGLHADHCGYNLHSNNILRIITPDYDSYRDRPYRVIIMRIP